MEENYEVIEVMAELPVQPKVRAPARNPIALYYRRAVAMELTPGYTHFLSPAAKEMYATELHKVYDVLFDRIMTAKVSPFLKQETEQWYAFNRDFIGFCDTAEMNRDLEGMLRRFNLL